MACIVQKVLPQYACCGSRQVQTAEAANAEHLLKLRRSGAGAVALLYAAGLLRVRRRRHMMLYDNERHEKGYLDKVLPKKPACEIGAEAKPGGRLRLLLVLQGLQSLEGVFAANFGDTWTSEFLDTKLGWWLGFRVSLLCSRNTS